MAKDSDSCKAGTNEYFLNEQIFLCVLSEINFWCIKYIKNTNYILSNLPSSLNHKSFQVRDNTLFISFPPKLTIIGLTLYHSIALLFYLFICQSIASWISDLLKHCLQNSIIFGKIAWPCFLIVLDSLTHCGIYQWGSRDFPVTTN